jgi:hypothetical protein
MGTYSLGDWWRPLFSDAFVVGFEIQQMRIGNYGSCGYYGMGGGWIDWLDDGLEGVYILDGFMKFSLGFVFAFLTFFSLDFANWALGM